MVNYRFSYSVKLSADDILKYFSYFSQKIGFDVFLGDTLHEVSMVYFLGKTKEASCMKCQSLCSGKKKKKKVINVKAYVVGAQNKLAGHGLWK